MSKATESIKRVLKLEGRIPEETTVMLAASNDGKRFNCVSCAAFLFNHQHRIVALVEDDMSNVLLSPPITLQCHKCGHVYHLSIF